MKVKGLLMKYKFLFAALVSTILAGCDDSAVATANPGSTKITPMTLETQEERVSYGMGIGLGERIKQESFAIDTDAFTTGFKDAVAGGADQLMSIADIIIP